MKLKVGDCVKTLRILSNNVSIGDRLSVIQAEDYGPNTQLLFFRECKGSWFYKTSDCTWFKKVNGLPANYKGPSSRTNVCLK